MSTIMTPPYCMFALGRLGSPGHCLLVGISLLMVTLVTKQVGNSKMSLCVSLA